MSPFRWNPILNEWVNINPKRQERPLLPTEGCPFCPGSGKVPSSYDVLLYPNDFPALELSGEFHEEIQNPLNQSQPGVGTCDVVLYTSNHNMDFSLLSREKLQNLFSIWRQRYSELKDEESIKYVLIFENKGEVIGVTIQHPHGQIYGYPFIPPRIQKELNSARMHYKKFQKCLFCDLLTNEENKKNSVLTSNDFFSAFIPAFASYPFETYLYPKRHGIYSLLDFNNEEGESFMDILKEIIGGFNNLFGFILPFMMVQHAAPVDGNFYDYYHFHVEFYPLHRNAKTIKFSAGSETGAGVHTNPTEPSEKASQLREAIKRFHKG
jgi:UDPglucose--hexose-1-phosphate uridylyltransferase